MTAVIAKPSAGISTNMQKRARASGVSPEYATPPSVQRPKGPRATVMTAAYTNATSVNNKRPELRFRTRHVDVVAVTKNWLRPGKMIII